MSNYNSSDLGLDYGSIHESFVSDDFRVDDVVSPSASLPHPISKVISNFCGLFDGNDVIFCKTSPVRFDKHFTAVHVDGDWFVDITYQKRCSDYFDYNIETGQTSRLKEWKLEETFEYISKEEFLDALNNFYSQFLPF